MKQIILVLLMSFELFATMIKAPIVGINEEDGTATVKLDHIDVGVSGFIVHKITEQHTTILKNVYVVSYDLKTKIATLKMTPFNALRNNSLPTGKWKVQVGDEAQLAFGYTRAVLIAPNEEIYHRITKSVKIQWVHIDFFATVLSYRGHPTPLKEDFEAMSIASGIGLVFFYLDQKVYTVDIKSFAIFSINDAVFKQDSVKLPFYSRVEKIEANFWGAGSDKLTEYAPHYYELLVKYNPKNRELYEIIKNGDEKLHFLLDRFEIGE